jgi:apolipoprotein N-acyltransferase
MISAALAVLAGLLLPLSLAPFDFWWSALVSIVLLLAVTSGASFKQALIRWYLFGIGQYLLGASWVFVSINTHGGASVLLASMLTGAFIAAISLVVLIQGYVYQRFFNHRSTWVIAFAALWFVKEWSTTWLLVAGFPWALLGYGQIDTALAGFAPVIGVLGVGFVVALMGSCFFAGVIHSSNRRWAWWITGVGIFLFGGVLSTLDHTHPAAEPLEVSLVQGNVAQQTKWRQEMVNPIIQNYTNLSAEEWGRDLIVWPEAAITVFEESAAGLLDFWDIQGKERGTALLLGIPSREGRTYYNSAVMVGSGRGKYIKRHLVPFGEYVPMEDYLRGVIEFFDLPMSHNKPGPEEQQLLKLDDLSLALSICYEIAFPGLVRQDANESALLITISNDTWFGESLGPHQHMQMAQMRALESGRYLLRSTNNGITAIVDEKGRMTGQLPQFESGVLRGLAVPMGGITPYSRWGDWPLLVALFVTLAYQGFRRAL